MKSTAMQTKKNISIISVQQMVRSADNLISNAYRHESNFSPVIIGCL